MVLYGELYFHLFNAVTDALEEMEAGNMLKAKEMLIEAQQETEEMFMVGKEN